MTDRDEFIRNFREIQPKFSRLCALSLNETRLTLPQYALLNQVASAGTMAMTEASEKLYLTKPAITNLVDRLEENKFLKRIPHPKDRRVFLLQILPKGEKLVRGMQSTILHVLLDTLDRFNAEEKKIISRFYVLLSQTMDEAIGKERGKR